MHKFKTPEWMVEWQKKFQPVLVEGLTDGPTYVKLCTKSLDALDVVLALRPVVGRITEDIIMVGGKLAVFPVKDSQKVQPASGSVMEQWMLSAFPKIEFAKVSPKRVGTMVGAAHKAGFHEGAEYMKAFADQDAANRLLGYIEEIAGAATEDRKQVLRAITEAYFALLPREFAPVNTGNIIEFNAVKSAKDQDTLH